MSDWHYLSMHIKGDMTGVTPEAVVNALGPLGVTLVDDVVLTPSPDSNIESWMYSGWLRGWAGPPVCSMCDGVPVTEDEAEDGACVYVIRMYSTPGERKSVEGDHAPSLWRASSRGWVRNDK